MLFSYLLGSIPTAYCLGRMAKGIDLRQHGSGNLGATNAFRVLGKGIGTTVLLFDIFKGALAVLLTRACFYDKALPISENLVMCLAAVAVVCGHNWTVFLKFKGGKGVATSLGVLIAFSIVIERFTWLVVGVTILWLIIFIPSGFVSLASVISSISLPLFAISFRLPGEILVFLLLLTALSLIRHKPNIIRLLQNKESRFDTLHFFKKLLKKALSK